MVQKIARLHKANLYAVIGIAFLCAAFGETLTLIGGGLFVAAVATSWFVSEATIVRESNRVWWNILIVAFLIYTIVQIAMTGEGYIKAGLRFILILTAIKLFSRSGARDELQLYALSFLIIAAATTVNEGVTYGLFFGAYVLSGTFSLALFHLKEELSNREAVPLMRRIPFDRRYMTVLAGLSVVIFLSSVAIFFGFPRIGLGYFAQQSRGGATVSGFSDSVELGSHGSVRNNPSVAMRVEFPNGRPLNYRQFHWRTITFDRYDGSGWSRTFDDTDREIHGRDGVYDIASLYGPERYWDRPSEELPEKVELYVEPLDSDLLPVLWPSRRLRFKAERDRHMPGNPRTGEVEVDAYGDLSHTVASDIGVSYVLETYERPNPGALADMDGEVPDTPRMNAYLQLPDGLSERIARLARRVTEEETTPYRKAKAIESHLRNNYTYTTDLPKVDPDHPVEDFLFTFKKGHCEYYATAMVLMLREIGIHARMVNGFLGGRWNRVGDFLAVRQADAHSWVEVYVAPYGWVQMDPTPAAVPSLYDNPAVIWMRDTYDTMRMQWMKWVIEYDLRSQIRLFRRLSSYLVPRGLMDGSSSEKKTEGRRQKEKKDDSWSFQPLVFWAGWLAFALASFLTSRRFDPRFRKFALGAVGVASAGLLAAWGWSFQTPGWSWAIGGLVLGLSTTAAGALTHFFAVTRGRSDVSQLFERIEVAGRRADTPRHSGETPGDYLERLAEAHPEVERQLKLFRRRYLAVRFGGHDLEAETLQTLREITREITHSLQSRT